MEIREFTPSDLSRIVAIEQASHIMPWTEDMFDDCLRAKYAFKVLLVKEQIVAFVIYSVVANEGHIFNLCVDKKLQRQGYGEGLLRYMLQELQQQKVVAVFLEVRKSNQAAIALYRKLKFEEIGERKNYYAAPTGREDAILFKLSF